MFFNDAIEDLLRTGEEIAKHNISTIVIDTERPDVKLEMCKKLAESANAVYYHIDNLNQGKLNDILANEGILRDIEREID